MEKNRENLNNPNQDLTQDLNSILGLDTQLNTNNLIIRVHSPRPDTLP